MRLTALALLLAASSLNSMPALAEDAPMAAARAEAMMERARPVMASRGEGRGAWQGRRDGSRWGGGSANPAPAQQPQAAPPQRNWGGRGDGSGWRSRGEGQGQWQGRRDGGNWSPPAAAVPSAPAPVAAPDGRRGWQGRSDGNGWRSRGESQGQVQNRRDGGNWQGRRDSSRWGGGQAAVPPAPGSTFDRNGNGRVDRHWDRNRNGVVDRNWDRNRDGSLDRRWDRNNDGQLDRRWDRNSNGRPDGWRDDRRRYDNRGWSGNHSGWDRGWRNDRRYDWYGWRDRNRNYYRQPRYYNPYGYGYGYSRLSVGIYLDSLFYSDRYWINDPWQYRLPSADGPYRWVRYYDDVLLVDLRTGYVVDAIHNFFW